MTHNLFPPHPTGLPGLCQSLTTNYDCIPAFEAFREESLRTFRLFTAVEFIAQEYVDWIESPICHYMARVLGVPDQVVHALQEDELIPVEVRAQLQAWRVALGDHMKKRRYHERPHYYWNEAHEGGRTLDERFEDTRMVEIASQAARLEIALVVPLRMRRIAQGLERGFPLATGNAAASGAAAGGPAGGVLQTS